MPFLLRFFLCHPDRSGGTPSNPPIGAILCYAMAALEIVTGAQRLLFALRLLRPE
jgi:hypothetical protein